MLKGFTVLAHDVVHALRHVVDSLRGFMDLPDLLLALQDQVVLVLDLALGEVRDALFERIYSGLSVLIIQNRGAVAEVGLADVVEVLLELPLLLLEDLLELGNLPLLQRRCLGGRQLLELRLDRVEAADDLLASFASRLPA